MLIEIGAWVYHANAASGRVHDTLVSGFIQYGYHLDPKNELWGNLILIGANIVFFLIYLFMTLGLRKRKTIMYVRAFVIFEIIFNFVAFCAYWDWGDYEANYLFWGAVLYPLVFGLLLGQVDKTLRLKGVGGIGPKVAK